MPPNLNQFFNLACNGLKTQRVTIAVIMIPSKSTKCTFCGADVGVVDVPIDDVSPIIFRMQPGNDGVGERAQFLERTFVVQLECLLFGQANAPFEDWIDVET